MKCAFITDYHFLVFSIFVLSIMACEQETKYYTSEDFEKVPKIDAHFHYLTTDTGYIKYAESINFKLLTPIWEGEIPLDSQLAISSVLRKKFPASYRYFTSFSTVNILEEGFADSAISNIKRAIEEGASGVKIWKNIGMTIRRNDGSFIMADDPLLTPVFKYLEDNDIPVIAHLGEPKNCWLPLDKMTDPGDSLYFSNNPVYHMFLHPEVPSYEKQIEAMENLLRNHPKLVYTGAHLASLEWSVDELAKRLDSFPGLNADMAARIFHLQYQSAREYDKVRNFMIKYQDRIIYGTDYEVHDLQGEDPDEIRDRLRRGWQNSWNYLATEMAGTQKGLNLPAHVIDKIFFLNAQKYFISEDREER